MSLQPHGKHELLVLIQIKGVKRNIFSSNEATATTTRDIYPNPGRVQSVVNIIRPHTGKVRTITQGTRQRSQEIGTAANAPRILLCFTIPIALTALRARRQAVATGDARVADKFEMWRNVCIADL